VIGLLAAGVSLLVTVGLNVHLTPDVDLYVGSGFGLYPSPLGTLVGSTGGYIGLALVQALAVGLLAEVIARRRPALPVLLGALPVAWWLLPLGVDAIAAALLAVLVVMRSRSAGWGAAGFHLAALPVVLMFARARVLVLGLLVGVVALVVTPYGAALPDAAGSVAAGLPAALVVLGLGLLPVAVGAAFPARVFVGVAAVVVYATTAHVESGESFGLSVFAASRYALPLVLCALLAGEVSTRASGAAYDGSGNGVNVRLKVFGLTLVVAAFGALLLSGAALAVTVPAVPVAAYGDSLLASLATAIGTIFPYAAAITAFAIAVGMVKRWLGHRKATRV
jgi:hypothetical protein